MQLLGSYKNKLSQFHYQQLLQLLQDAISAGDYGGGKLFDKTAADRLKQQADDFASLPGVLAGSRASAASLNQPLELLSARYQAISQEREDFLEQMDRLLAVLEKDSNLIDQLLAAAAMERWVSRRPPLSESRRFYQDFAATHGATAVSFPLTDPETGVPYSKKVQDVGYLLKAVPGLEDEPVRTGVGVPAAVNRIRPINMRWHFESAGDSEDLIGPDWGKLSILEPSPRLTYGDPTVTVLVPQDKTIYGVFEISGREEEGNLPVFVRTLTQPRRLSVAVTLPAAGGALTLSTNRVQLDDVLVLDDARSYDQGIDYQVTDLGQVVPLSPLGGRNVTVKFTELYPAYQSSINQQDWGPVIMLDPSRPYPDGTRGALHLTIENDRFPITDETGRPLGLFLRMLARPQCDYLFRVDTVVAAGYGMEATLELELDKPSYINGFHLAPAVNFPFRLMSVTAEGLTSDTSRMIYWGGDVLDRPVSLRFPRQLVHRLYLNFRQENYSYKEQVIDPADKLRREALQNLQSVLPFSLRRTVITPARVSEGAQYEFGLSDLYAEDWTATMPQDYGVIILGPFEVPGNPELIRLDADFSGDVKFYLIDVPFDVNGVLVQSSFHETNPHGIEVVPGRALAFTPPAAANISKVQFYVKIVLRSEYAVAERFLLEVSNV